MNITHPKAAFEKLLNDNLKNEQAKNFLVRYVYYIEFADELVDAEAANMANAVKNFSSLAIQVFNHPYYVRYREALCMVEVNNNINYFTSINWEKSNSEWKRRDAMVLARCGIDMINAVMVLELGIENARPLLEKFREDIHLWRHYGKKQFNTTSIDKPLTEPTNLQQEQEGEQ